MLPNTSDPAEIIPNLLYLGSASTSANKEVLQAKGVKAILSLAAHRPLHFPDDFKYLKIAIDDDHQVQINEHFDTAINFITECLEHNLPVFVHCEAGISRSATIILCYLITKKNMTLQEAFTHVKTKRPVIGPNIGFMQQLIDHEEKLYKKSTITLREYFINSIEEMGYPRASIEKSVEKYGLDPQKVLFSLLDEE